MYVVVFMKHRMYAVVRSLVLELNRQPKIFNHEHVPHLRLPHRILGAGELEQAA